MERFKITYYDKYLRDQVTIYTRSLSEANRVLREKGVYHVISMHRVRQPLRGEA